MKYKIIALAALAVIIYSCAAKSSTPTATAEVKPAPKAEVKNIATVVFIQIFPFG